MTESSVLFALLRHQICGEKVSEEVKNVLTPEILKGVYKLAGAHDLAHLAGQSLSQLGALGDDEVSQAFKKAAMQAVYRYVQLNFEYEQACSVLEKAKIPFIPLKGSVLRAHYPEPWMRTSSDMDILVKPENLDAAAAVLAEELGYVAGKKDEHDIPMRSKTGLLLELHYDTMEERHAVGKRYEMLGRIWDYAAPKKEDSYHYYLSDDMFYFFHIAHMAKHFEMGGCGIRTFMDLWIMSHRMEFDAQKREKILKDGNLMAFATGAEALTACWFNNAPKNELTSQMEAFVLWGGTFGNIQNKAIVGQAREGSKVKYLLSRVFLPYSTMKQVYPVLQKHKWLTPVYHPIRWAEMVFRGDMARTMSEVKHTGETNTSQRDAMAQMLRELDM